MIIMLDMEIYKRISYDFLDKESFNEKVKNWLYGLKHLDYLKDIISFIKEIEKETGKIFEVKKSFYYKDDIETKDLILEFYLKKEINDFDKFSNNYPNLEINYNKKNLIFIINKNIKEGW